MAIAPQQDWSYYEAKSREATAKWLRSISWDERLAIYEDMFNVFWDARREMPGDWERLNHWQWNEKVAVRRRMVETYRKRDERLRGRTVANNVG